MPGVVVFRRRWSVGSDDLVVPAVFLLIVHGAWILALSIIIGVVEPRAIESCPRDLHNYLLGCIIILSLCFVLELVIAIISMQGGILDSHSRRSMQHLLYSRLVVFAGEFAWLVIGLIWLSRFYSTCFYDAGKKLVLGIVVWSWLEILIVLISIWCAFDSAGRKWVKMKEYQDNLKDRRRVHRKMSGSTRRNWRQRKAFRAYEESWDRRLQLLCCCVERKGRNRNSMAEIAQLFTEFFRDLDVVPSDVIAGLVLLRQNQKRRMASVVHQANNSVYQYLSGVPITPETQFLQLNVPSVLAEYKRVIHYMKFALAAYGWPATMMMNPKTWMCRLFPLLSCCSCRKQRKAVIINDNCCLCNFSALRHISGLKEADVVYSTYHVDIAETPFFVALDHTNKAVVVCVRGTLSLQDILTDLKAEAETLPVIPPRDDWQGHRGMVQAAVYIKKKLDEEAIIERAMALSEEHTSSGKYTLTLVGHSLGAGTAAILAILLHREHPNLRCYAFSPPGGLISFSCVEETKEFITSVVVGKDVVPRIGLPQMEMLRTDIINMIKQSEEPKWKIISNGLLCCSGKYSDVNRCDFDLDRDVTAHPSDSGIGLSAHVPLFPPGKIMHIVRSRTKDGRRLCNSSERVYQAVWAGYRDLNEVLISPTMVNDHMPDNVLDALEKVLLKDGPTKPIRTLSEVERKELLTEDPLLPASHAPPDLASMEEGGAMYGCNRDYGCGEGHGNFHSVSDSCDKNSGCQMLMVEHINQLNSSNGRTEASRPDFALDLSKTRVVAPLASPDTFSDTSASNISEQDKHSNDNIGPCIELRVLPSLKTAEYVNCEPNSTLQETEILNSNHCFKDSHENVRPSAGSLHHETVPFTIAEYKTETDVVNMEKDVETESKPSRARKEHSQAQNQCRGSITSTCIDDMDEIPISVGTLDHVLSVQETQI